MGDRSAIEWTDATWNPVTGCSKVSPGCAHCYAATLAPRLARMGQRGYTELPWTPENAAANVFLHEDRLDMPVRWTRPRRVFVNSMSDLFHELVPDEYIDRVFAAMLASSHHVFQVLTKRPDRMRAYLSEPDRPHRVAVAMNAAGWARSCNRNAGKKPTEPLGVGWPMRHVWLGTSVENQTWADRRIPDLVATPAAVRFLSCEPLLGPVDFANVTGRSDAVYQWGRKALDGIGWVIVGGESGPVHRPVDPAWVRSIRDQCDAAGVPFFLKQWGGARAGGKALLDGREWREFPHV